MDIRSGLTYITVNKETRFVLDDPVGEGELVNVNHLNVNNTQKAWRSVSYRDLSLTYIVCIQRWILSQGRDGLWTLQNVKNGKFLCTETPHSKHTGLVNKTW